MEKLIANAIVGVVVGIIRVVEETGKKVDLDQVMNLAHRQASDALKEYQKQRNAQAALFPKGSLGGGND